MAIISVRVTDEERLVWSDRAEKEGRSLSEWVRDRCNEGVLKGEPVSGEVVPKTKIEIMREVEARVNEKYEQKKSDLKSVESRKSVTAADIMTGKVTRGSISRETYQVDEWVDPI